MSLIAWYKLDGNALDSSRNRLHGTPTNVGWVDGKIAQAGEFSSSYVSLNTPVSSVGDFSVSFWGMTTSPNNQNFACSRTSVGEGFSIFLLGGYLRIDTNSAFQWTTSYYYPLNQWVHVVVTRTSQEKKLFINGVFHSSTSDVPSDPLLLSSIYTFGASHSNGTGWGNYLLGKVDDYRIYDHALSEKEIKELAKAKVLHYTFDEFQEPTENIVTNTNLDTGWSKNYCTDILWNDVSPPAGINSQVVSFIDADGNGTGYWFCYGDYAPQTPSTTYTISVYARTIGSSWSMYAYTADNSEIGRQSTNTLTVPGDGNWHRLVFNPIFNPADSQSDSLSFDFSNIPPGQRCWLCAPQMEAKDHATPFVNGTRTGSVSDNSGYGNNAVLASATTPQWTEDSRIGKGAYKFNGTTSGIERIGNFSDIKTISMWVKSQSIPTDSRVLLVHSPTEVGLGFFNNGYLILSSSGTTQRQRTAIISGFKNNSWNHIAVTYSDTKVPTCYINGVETTYSDTNYWTAPETTLYIGRRTSGSVFDGQIDDVRIYATALSADDIKELYNTRAQIDNKGNFFVNNINQTGHKPLLLDYTTWQNGQVGAIGQFGINGSSEESVRVITDDPWGKASVVWETRPDAGNDADGGWNSSYVTVDNTKDYRFVVWVRRPTNETGGTFYLGLNSSIIRNDTGAVESNPYFSYIGQSELSVGVWYLVVGHCFNKDYTGGIHPDSGWYTVIDGKIATKSYGNIGTSDCRFQTAQIGILHRTYHFYSTNVLARLQFAYPRIDVCDGTEPSIAELLSGFDSTYIDFIREKGGTATLPLNVGDRLTYVGEISEIGPANGLVAYYPLNGNAKDYVNANDGTVVGATISAGINGKACYSFDGEDDYIQIGSPITGIWDSPFTFSIWVKATSGSGRGVLLGDYSMTNALNVNIEWNSPNLRLYWAGSPDIQASLSLAYDTWNFLTIVRDKSSSQVRFYKDGVLGYTYSGNLADKTATTNLHRIGSDGRTGEPVFNGSIQNVRIYNRALSQEEISILYDLEKGDTIKAKMDKNTLYIGGQIYEG